VAVALAFATTRMLKDKNLVRLLRSCEIMGNATTICSDKTGTLTQNQMSVVAGIIGDRGFGMKDSTGNDGDSATSVEVGTSSTDMRDFFQGLNADTRKLLQASVALNSTAFEQDTEDGTEFVGSGTETALLRLGRNVLNMGPLSELRHNSTVVELLPFSSRRKWMAVVIKVDGKFLMLVKGAAEIVMANCSHVLQDPSQGLAQAPLEAERRGELLQTTQALSNQLLRPIALAYRELDTWPIAGETKAASAFEKCFKEQVTLLGILGIRDPLRPEVVSAVKACQAAGVFVRMVTGDNFTTAKAIASECGIYTAGGIAMDGPTFRKLSEDQLDLVIPRLQVLARSSPDDKQVLVRHLKKLGETVAVTGDGTNDAFALKAADIGFAMGISGTDIAKEACAIVLMDDNFASIVKALAWGRAINDAAKKFIQFQFTINITAGILTIISTLVADIDSAVFAVIQLLWLNLIMDIFAALALATDFPTKAQMERRPEPRNAPIVNARMWKMILGQAVYQLVVVFTLHYAGENFFAPETHLQQLQTLVFNVYMFMQVFNQINCRRVDNRFNIFEGVHKNPWFIGVQAITIGGQVIIIIKGRNAFQVEALSATQWGWCIFFGFLTLPIGAMIRLFPDKYVVSLGHSLKPVLWPVRRVTAILRRRRAAKATAKREKEESEEEPDEERRIRRMQWTLPHKKRTAGGRPIGSGVNTPAERRSLTMGDGETAPNFMETSDPGTGLIEAIRHNRLDLPRGVEVHPRTSKDDPVLFEEQNSKIPPSQHHAVLKYLELP
jgi:Ca2+-transporting ATPase